MNEPTPFRSWALVEAMGHRTYLGLAEETTLAGAQVLRVDVPQEGETQAHTVYVAGSSLYAVTPMDEETVRALIRSGRSAEPIQQWQARRLLAPEVEVEVETIPREPAPDDDDAQVPF